ncbi:MAG: hypothetical protein MJ195_03455 [Mycoplasmoidaceae bacterium]|nr:hypothetical protein [Mycoplasmoidaceae bacterium]MCQ3915760.1 hypothetical protein [Mycoplasmoidaceae bacterium]
MPLVSCGEKETNNVYDYDNLIQSYRKMLLETIDTSRYADKTAEKIIEEELEGEVITKFSKPYDSYRFNQDEIDYDDPNPSL